MPDSARTPLILLTGDWVCVPCFGPTLDLLLEGLRRRAGDDDATEPAPVAEPVVPAPAAAPPPIWSGVARVLERGAALRRRRLIELESGV